MKKPGFIAVTGLVASVSLFALGCASSMVPKSTRQADSIITGAVQTALNNEERVGARNIGVETREGIVYLNGVVNTEDGRREAGRIAWRTKDVDGVVNDLTVGERTVGSWIDDVMITSKIKAKLIGNSEIRSGDIDVSSSQGVVTLIGRVASNLVRSDAERVARGTSGVTSVNNELLVGNLHQ